MLKNLVANGASFTAGDSWASEIRYELDISEYTNLAQIGAGNYYICNSTIDFLTAQDYDPQETLVLIMWAGTGNCDIRLSGEWAHHLLNTEYVGAVNPLNREDSYYLFSGGLSNSWTRHSLTKDIFKWHYKINDPRTLCKDSLMQFIFLENYLKLNGYKFLFVAPGNCWKDHEPTYYAGNYTIGYFCNDVPALSKYSLEHWVFVNEQRDGFYEFAQARRELDKTDHPTLTAHRYFADEVVIPSLDKIAR